MDDRTLSYLEGRFGDYYRSADLTLPPEIDAREWGHIPWSQSGIRMIRHKSLLEIGDPDDFLAQNAPRHVYTSAAKYEEPGAQTMDAKHWQSSDLIFDIDIDEDHLPDSVDDDADLSYEEMLALAKDHLQRLLVLLEEDFGFEDLEIVFSGGRGYHVHIRDPHIQSLKSNHRTELVSYIQGVNLDLDSLTRKGRTTVGTNVSKNDVSFRPEGGWASRVHTRLIKVLEETLALVDSHNGVTDEAVVNLSEYKRIGEDRAKVLAKGFVEHENAIRAGKLTATAGLKPLCKTLLEEVWAETYANIDEPVTTDINRLIRLPGSLHGGMGLQVTRIPRDEVEDFDPLVDAIPETFTRQDITVEVAEPITVRMNGDTFDLSEGEATVPEYVGIHLMAQGAAEKLSE